MSDKSFDLAWKVWKRIEGFYNPNDGDNTIAIYGLNSKYNPEVFELIKFLEANKPTEDVLALLESKVKAIFFRRYWVNSLKNELPEIHFFYQNAWSSPYTRSLNSRNLAIQLRNSPEEVAALAATSRITFDGVLRRIRIYHEYYN